MDNKNKHLPLFGVGPIIVYGQVLITVVTIILVSKMNWNFASF